MSSALVGCLFGAISVGTVSDKFGRKKPLILAATIFTISAIGTGAANSLTIFIIYRIIGGLGIGMCPFTYLHCRNFPGSLSWTICGNQSVNNCDWHFTGPIDQFLDCS